MTRKPRFYVPGVPVHVVQRGNNRQAIFFDESDYKAYLNWLREALEKYDCYLHAYVLMTNHVHLLLSSEQSEGVSRMMQYVGRYYVPYVNHTYGRSGTLWEGRYKASLVDEDDYLLICMRYIELNPVRAGMVDHPGDYRWTSFHTNAGPDNDRLITPHFSFMELGETAVERKACYRNLFKVRVDDAMLSGIRSAWQTGTPLGNDRFREEIGQVLQKTVGYDHRGRPRSEKGL